MKNYLVKSMRLDPERILTRGFGKLQPLITSGDAKTQAPNRRVEIRMRNTPPPKEDIKVIPKARPAEVKPEPEPEPPKAVLVKPNLNAIPVEEPAAPRAEVVPPRATPIEEDAPVAVPRAVPIEP